MHNDKKVQKQRNKDALFTHTLERPFALPHLKTRVRVSSAFPCSLHQCARALGVQSHSRHTCMNVYIMCTTRCQRCGSQAKHRAPSCLTRRCSKSWHKSALMDMCSPHAPLSAPPQHATAGEHPHAQHLEQKGRAKARWSVTT